MTNDGDLTNKLTHPRYGHEKEYRVLLARRPDEEQLATWRRGVVLEDGDKSAPANVHLISTSGKGAWIRVVMGEGKKRQIREIGGLLGLPVVKIIRMRIGTLRLGTLKPRQWRYLTAEEIEALKGESKSEFAQAPRPRVKRFRPRKDADSKPRKKPFEMPSGKSTSRPKPPGRPSKKSTY
jgi:23S rRNA pseudouridine2605 synthase